MRRFLSFGLATLALASFASAQNCSDLTIGGTSTPGGTVTVDLSGSTANALTLLFIGTTAGSTSIPFGPLGTLDLGLDAPFGVFPAGFTDGSGALSLSFGVPAGLTQQVTVFVQASSFGLTIQRPNPPTLSFCTSDVESVTLG